MVRISLPAALDARAWAELRAIPGLRVRNGTCAAPPDVATRVADLAGTPAPGWSRPAWPLARDPESIPGWTRLRPFQREAALSLARGAHSLLWLPCGAGKTAVVLAAARLRGACHTLVVTRAMGVGSFLRDAAWCGGLHIVAVRGRGPDGKIAAAHAVADVLVLNYEVLESRLEDLGPLPWDLLICDESHYLRSYRYRDYARWCKAAECLAAAVWRQDRGDVWLSTGTPVRDRRRDLFRQLCVVHPDGRWGRSWGWMHRYCDARRGRFGGLDTEGKSNSEELRERVRFYAFRRTKAETLGDLPPKTRDIVRIERTAMGASRRQPRSFEVAVAESASLKIPEAVEMALDALRAPGKVVLVTNRHRDVPRIAEGIARGAATMSHGSQAMRGFQLFVADHEGGALPPDERRRVCDEYLVAADPAALVATHEAVGESIDLQRTDCCIALALPWNSGLVEQLEGRFTRQGQDRPFRMVYLVAAGTVDEEIEERLLSKLDDVERLRATTAGDLGGFAATRNLPTEDEMRTAMDRFLRGVGPVAVDEDLLSEPGETAA